MDVMPEGNKGCNNYCKFVLYKNKICSIVNIYLFKRQRSICS